MAKGHGNSALGNSVNANDGTSSVRVNKEGDTTTAESSSFFTAKEEFFSTRIQSILESRSSFKTALESEIEASKEHWSEVPAEIHGGEGSSAEKNLEVFRSLQRQHNIGPGAAFFQDWDDDKWAVGEKIAEGAQGEIFTLRLLRPEAAEINNRVALKVFKLEGWSLQDLQQQWPPGMLLKATTSEDGAYYLGEGPGIVGGVMLNDGRFAFIMLRCWGDLRKLIDLRMEHNGNEAPPFTDPTAMQIMLEIAIGMRELHSDNIVHRDLKASNVLIFPTTWEEDDFNPQSDGFDPTNNDDFDPCVADFETSLGVWGTRFWRAPEVLLGLKNRNIQPSLFTEKSDVYSYAMTCYEILTGKIPLEDVRPNDYDAVLLHGARPRLPSGMEPWIESLLSRCWDQEPSVRPSFEEIVKQFNSNGYDSKTYCILDSFRGDHVTMNVDDASQFV